MISKEEKKYLIFKVVIILFIALFALAIARVLFVHNDYIGSGMIYPLIAKELFFSIFSTVFVAGVIYVSIQKEIFRVNTKAKKFAFTDALTGLYNRHYLNGFLDKFTSLSKEDTNFAVVFIDIDKFKQVNDTLGHATGDCILKLLALKLKSLTRPDDILCRYGGEEFVIIFSDISKENALEKAEEIRTKVEDMVFDCEQKRITISIGLSSGSNDDDINAVMEESDKALYMAKEAGRNCVKVFNESSEVP